MIRPYAAPIVAPVVVVVVVVLVAVFNLSSPSPFHEPSTINLD